MMVTFHYSASAAVTLALLLTTLVGYLSDIVSTECVECQLLLSQHAALQSPGIIIIIIIISIPSSLYLARLHYDDSIRC